MRRVALFAVALSVGSCMAAKRTSRSDPQSITVQAAVGRAGQPTLPCAPAPAGAPVLVPQFLNFGAGRAVTFSADNRLAATLDDSPEIRLWDVQAGELRALLRADDVPVRSLAFSPTAPLLLARSDDGSARMWDLTNGTSTVISPARAPSVARGRGIPNAVFSPDGQLIAVRHEERIHLVPLSGPARANIGGEWAQMTLSPDSKTLLTWASSKGLTAWDTVSGSSLWHTEQGKFYYAAQAAFSPNGRAVAWCRLDDNLYLSDASTGTVRRTIPLGEPVWSAAFTRDGTRLVAGLQSSIVVLDYPSMARRSTIPNVTGETMRLSNTRNLVASYDKLIVAVDVASGRVARQLNAEASVFQFAISPDGNSAAALPGFRGDGLVVWDLQTGLQRKLAPRQSQTYNLDWSPDGTAIVSTSHGGGVDDSSTARIWNASTGAIQQVLVDDERRFPPGFHYVAWSPAGNRIALSTMTDVTLWDPQTGRRVCRLDDDENYHSEHAIAFAPDGKVVATSGGRDAEVRLWNAERCARIGTFPTGVGHVWRLGYSPDGGLLALGSVGVVKLLDATTGAEVGTLRGSFEGVEDLAWVPNTTQLVAATQRGSVHVFNGSTGAELWSYRYEEQARIRGMSVSRDGALAAWGTEGSNLQVWDLRKRAKLFEVPGMAGEIYSVAWHPRAPVLAAARGGIQLTRMPDGATIVMRSIDQAGRPSGLAYTSSGLFSGDRPAFAHLLFRAGTDVASAPLLRADAVQSQLYRPTLIGDLVRGCPL